MSRFNSTQRLLLRFYSLTGFIAIIFVLKIVDANAFLAAELSIMAFFASFLSEKETNWNSSWDDE